MYILTAQYAPLYTEKFSMLSHHIIYDVEL
jgi:hypothetical protein